MNYNLNDTYENNEYLIIKGFAEQLKKGYYLENNIDLMSGKSKDLFKDYIDLVHNTNAVEYKIDKFDKIISEDFLDISYKIIYSIFGDKIKDDFNSFLSNLKLNNSNSVFDGVTYEIMPNNEDIVIYLSNIPSITSIGCIPCLVHEFMHYYIYLHNIDLNKKRYYEEILSLYVEKIAANYINSLMDNKFNFKIESNRLDCINWHYYIHPDEVKKCIQIYDMFNSKNDANIQALIKTTLEAIPWLKNQEERKIALNYKSQLADSYGLGYLYSTYLFNRYLDDKETTKNEINKVLHNENSLNDCFDYFGINGRNKKMYEEVKEHIRTIK